MRNHHNSWPEERTAKLRELRAAGQSSGKIALLLGVTRNSVVGMIHRLGLGGVARVQSARPARPKVERRAAPDMAKLRAQPRQVVEEPSPECAISFAVLCTGRCHWPYGDPRDFDNLRYCGADAPRGEDYCPYHRQLATGNRIK